MKRLVLALLAALAGGQAARAQQMDFETRLWTPSNQPGVGGYPAAFAPKTFAAPSGTALPYRLLTPPAATSPAQIAATQIPASAIPVTRIPASQIALPQTRPSAAPLPPLVIMLHGSGMAMGKDNLAQIRGPFMSQWGNPDILGAFPAYVAAPQVAVRSVNYMPSSDGLMASVPGPALADLLALAEELVRTLPIDRRRVYLIGFSMGGSATLQMLLARPDLFAAGVAFAPIGPDRNFASLAVATPVMLIHGDQDPENRVEPDRAWFEALTRAGGKPKMVVYHGMDHRVPTDMVAPGGTWRNWLFSQVKADTPRTSVASATPQAPAP